MRIIYGKYGYSIYKSTECGIIAHNTGKEFANGHTHVNNVKTAKYLIDMCHYKRIPRHLSIYLLVSLLRLSDDGEYQNKISALIEEKKQRKQTYYNVNKGCNK